MAFMRFQLDLAIPEDVYNAIPLATKIAFRDRVRAIKAKAVKLNEGLANEEATVRAVYHVCRHDEGNQSCEPEQEI